MEAGKILVVDGDDAVRDLIREALEEEGYRVLPAAPGEGLVGALREHPARHWAR